jgi:intracellular sulfur oxidation DsrE/DsrF family protein
MAMIASRIIRDIVTVQKKDHTPMASDQVLVRRFHRGWTVAAIVLFAVVSRGEADESAFPRARANSRQFEQAVQAARGVLRAWLGHADAETLLLPDRPEPDRSRWIYTPHNSGADLYPYLIPTAQLTDPDVYRGRMMEMLRNEVRYTTVQRSIPANLNLATHDAGPPSFLGAGEYAKDGLIAVSEYLGRTNPSVTRPVPSSDDPESPARYNLSRSGWYIPTRSRRRSMNNDYSSRRSLMLGVGSAVVAAGLGARSAGAQTPAAFRPSRHPEDGWLDQRSGKHRIFIDSATPNGAGEAILYASNLYNAQKAAYAGGNDPDLAIVVCMRHFATVFAYNDAVWSKYGKAMSGMLNFTDPKTKEAPSTNLYYNSTAYGLSMPNLGNTIEAVTKRGVYFAVCDTATHFLAAQFAPMLGSTADAIYKDLSTGLIPNSRLVSAGVMALTRAQEHGYSVLHAG